MAPREDTNLDSHKNIVDTNDSNQREVLGLGVLDIAGNVGGRAGRRESGRHTNDECITVDVNLVGKVHLVPGISLLKHVHLGEDIANCNESSRCRVEAAASHGRADCRRWAGKAGSSQRAESCAERHCVLRCGLSGIGNGLKAV